MPKAISWPALHELHVVETFMSAASTTCQLVSEFRFVCLQQFTSAKFADARFA